MINKYKALDCSKYENYLIRQLFSITQSMFVYKGDDDFRFDMLELFNQLGGNAIVAEYDGKLYPFSEDTAESLTRIMNLQSIS